MLAAELHDRAVAKRRDHDLELLLRTKAGYRLEIRNPKINHAQVVSNAMSAPITLFTAIVAFYFGPRSAQGAAAAASDAASRISEDSDGGYGGGQRRRRWRRRRRRPRTGFHRAGLTVNAFPQLEMPRPGSRAPTDRTPSSYRVAATNPGGVPGSSAPPRGRAK